MKRIIITCLLLLPGLALFAQTEKTYINQGNKLYQSQQYKEAEAAYRKSLAQKNQSVAGNFNLGDALFKQKKYDQAAEQFTKMATTAGNNKPVAAQAYHNLGNAMLQQKKLEESIEAYKKALLANPKDDQTRYNLAYAQQKLKQQQQQNKNNKNNKQNQQNKNQQDKQNQNKDDKQNKDNKDKQDKDKQNQQNKDQQDKDKQNGQNQPQPNKLSKEEAQRMLEALNNNEKQTQEKLKNKKLKGVKGHISKDW